MNTPRVTNLNWPPRNGVALAIWNHQNNLKIDLNAGTGTFVSGTSRRPAAPEYVEAIAAFHEAGATGRDLTAFLEANPDPLRPPDRPAAEFLEGPVEQAPEPEIPAEPDPDDPLDMTGYVPNLDNALVDGARDAPAVQEAVQAAQDDANEAEAIPEDALELLSGPAASQAPQEAPEAPQAPRDDLEPALAGALADVEAGYPVLLIRPEDKRPQEKGWPDRLIRTAAELRARWRQGLNYGLAAVAASGLLIVDVDVKGDAPGEETVRRWAEEAGVDLQPFKFQRTPSGGLHLIGRIPEGYPVDGLPNGPAGPGVDALRDRRYVVRAPSTTPGGSYTAVRPLPAPADLLEWPVAFLDLLVRERGSTNGPAEPLPEVIPEGQRETWLASFAGSMRARGASEEAILAALQAENSSGRVEPPLDPADLERIAHSMARYAPAPDAIPSDPAADFAAEEPAGGVGPMGAAPLAVQTIGELLAEPRREVRWLVEDLIPTHGASLIVGKPKTGKTTLLWTLAEAVATGADFLGRKVRKGRVLYLLFHGEGGKDDVVEHFQGKYDGPDIALWTGTAPQDMPARLGATLDQVRPDLVIVDTLHKLLRVPDLNDYAKVNNELAPYHELFQGVHVLYAHHARKSESDDLGDTALGSTALTGATEVNLYLRRREDRRTLSSEHRAGSGRDMEPTYLDLDPTGRVVSGGLVREEANLRAREQILANLAATEEPVREEEALAGVRIQEGRRALRQMVEIGMVERTGLGQRGDAYHYALPANADEFREEMNEDE